MSHLQDSLNPLNAIVTLIQRIVQSCAVMRDLDDMFCGTHVSLMVSKPFRIRNILWVEQEITVL